MDVLLVPFSCAKKMNITFCFFSKRRGSPQTSHQPYTLKHPSKPLIRILLCYLLRYLSRYLLTLRRRVVKPPYPTCEMVIVITPLAFRSTSSLKASPEFKQSFLYLQPGDFEKSLAILIFITLFILSSITAANTVATTLSACSPLYF